MTSNNRVATGWANRLGALIWILLKQADSCPAQISQITIPTRCTCITNSPPYYFYLPTSEIQALENEPGVAALPLCTPYAAPFSSSPCANKEHRPRMFHPSFMTAIVKADPGSKCQIFGPGPEDCKAGPVSPSPSHQVAIGIAPINRPGVPPREDGDTSVVRPVGDRASLQGTSRWFLEK